MALEAWNSNGWEARLLRRAYHAMDNHTPTQPLTQGKEHLIQAYAHCTKITREHSRTFYLASNFLPPEQRQAARAMYAFCRVSDDLVDCMSENRYPRLLEWRKESLANHPPVNNLVALAWADARATFEIPRQYAEQLLDGIATDLEQSRYQTFNDLAHYCYGVASTVGLMTMHMVGYSDIDAIPYAIKLGVALQLTNILRDIHEDWVNGRLYLPQDELEAFGLSEADIAAGVVDDRWRDFMRYQIHRARLLYAEALPGIALLGRGGRFAIGAAAELYQAILDDIEAHDYDVFQRRAHTTAVQKLNKLPGIWLRARKGYRSSSPTLPVLTEPATHCEFC